MNQVRVIFVPDWIACAGDVWHTDVGQRIGGNSVAIRAAIRKDTGHAKTRCTGFIGKLCLNVKIQDSITIVCHDNVFGGQVRCRSMGFAE